MDTNLDITTIIRSTPLFFELSVAQIKKIANISDLIEIDPGDQPIREGSILDFLYIILEGEISVDIFVPIRGAVETSRLGPLDMIGWSAMTPMIRQRTATTTALTHCWLLRIDAKLLAGLCEEDHDIGFLIYRRVANTTAMSFLTTRIQLMNLIAEKK
jgi:CRP/FNR family cyclic AMP-dependent transcriptional regulator